MSEIRFKALPIIEIFGSTIQGEGPLIGQLTHFIRLGGCGYRCTWCDSMHAVDPDQIKANTRYMSAGEITREVLALGSAKSSAQYVTISGGDPLMWDLSMLVANLQEEGYKISIETQGQFYKKWLMDCDNIVVSPKPPSSGMQDKIDHAILRNYVAYLLLHQSGSHHTQLSFKIVVFDETDFDWAIDLHKMYPEVPFFLSVGTSAPIYPELDPPTMPDVLREDILERYDSIIELAKKKKVAGDIRILPQTHVLLYGHKKGV